MLANCDFLFLIVDVLKYDNWQIFLNSDSSLQSINSEWDFPPSGFSPYTHFKEKYLCWSSTKYRAKH